MATHERIGRALNSKNLKQDEQHFDADVVAALAFAPQLGASLQALVSAGHCDELSRTVVLLTDTLLRAGRRKRIGFGKLRAETIAQQALIEWAIRICRSCNGSGYRLVMYTFDADQPKKQDSCLHCEGTGVFMPVWEWRAQSMGLTDQDPAPHWWEKRIDFAKEILDDAYRAARRNVTRQLSDLAEP